MAKDERLYAKLTLDFADSPKVLPLSDAAFRCLVEATLYSRRIMSDGVLPSRLATAKWGVEVLEELSTNDPERPSLVKVENGWLIHDFAEHQDTRAEIEARQARNRANGSKGGQARAKRVANRRGEQEPSETQAETETETETETSPSDEGETTPRKRGVRLPTNWMPSSDLIESARSFAPDVDLKAEHEVFVDYWIALPGQKGVKTDWSATWRNWMRRKQSDLTARQTTSAGFGPHRPPTRGQQNLDYVARLATQMQEQTQKEIA